MDTPALAEVLSAALDARAAEVHTATPARVVSYSRTSALATVEPLVWTDGERPPQLEAVPVVWPRTATAGIVLPLAAGDTGLLIVCESDLGEWRRTGEPGPPGDAARHHFANAVFLPGLVARATPSIVCGVGQVVIHVEGTDTLQLGDAAATNAVLGGTAFRAALNTWLTALAVEVPAMAAANGILLAAVDAALSTKVRVAL